MFGSTRVIASSSTRKSHHQRNFATNSGHASVAVVGTFPPTQCGLATFTHSLTTALRSEGWPVGVIDVVDEFHSLRSPLVKVQWERGNDASLQRCRQELRSFDTVVLQHEFGIFGGPDGQEVLDLTADLEASLVVVLHTVLEAPSPNQRRIMEALVTRADALVTLTGTARDRLLRAIDVDPAKVHVIAHGAHEVTVPRRVCRDHPVVLTWGLLGPGKGIEHMIDAMALVGDVTLPSGRVVSPRYVISGDTHPKILQTMGDSYRRSLVERASAVGIADRVTFVDGYKDLASLHRLIASADVVALPYDSREQVTSGVLVEAVAAGLPTICTAFPHATELESQGVGIVVPHEDPVALASALRTVFGDPVSSARLRVRAEQMSGDLLWSSVAREFGQLCDRLADAQQCFDVSSQAVGSGVGR